MSACETCWTEASRRAFMKGGDTVSHYHELLAENPTGHEADDAQEVPC